MNCQVSPEQVHRYLDEELNAQEREELERHLEGCADCRRIMQELGQGIALLMQAEWMKAPANFTENLLTQLDAVAPPKRNLRVPFMKYAGIAAAAVLVLGMGMSMAMPEGFAFTAKDKSGQIVKNASGLIVQNGKVIVPEGSEYDGDLDVQNGDIEVRGKVNGNVTAYNGRVLRMAGADISGETQEVDQALEKLVYYGKHVWQDITEWSK